MKRLFKFIEILKNVFLRTKTPSKDQGSEKINSNEPNKIIVDLLTPIFLRFKFLPKAHQGDTVIVASLPKEFNNNKLINLLNSKPNILATKTSSIIKIHTEEAQFNLHCVEDEDLDWVADIYSYSLPPIIGKIFKKADLIINEEGLKYVQQYENNGGLYDCGQIILTKDYKKVLEILGLDYAEWQKGFQTEESVFEFVCKSPFLNPEAFTRNDKIIRNETLSNFKAFLLKRALPVRKKLNLYYVISQFPENNFFGEIEKLEDIARNKEEVVNKFDGRTIIEVFPDLEKKRVGEYYSKFKFSFGNAESFRKFIIESNKEQIISKLKEVIQ